MSLYIHIYCELYILRKLATLLAKRWYWEVIFSFIALAI